MLHLLPLQCLDRLVELADVHPGDLVGALGDCRIRLAMHRHCHHVPDAAALGFLAQQQRVFAAARDDAQTFQRFLTHGCTVLRLGRQVNS